MPTFFERVPRLRFTVTPGLVGRVFRRLAAIGRRLDAENVAIGTLAATRKTENRAEWTLSNTIGYFNRPDNLLAAGQPRFNVGDVLLEYDATLDTGANAVEILGWSIISTDLQFTYTDIDVEIVVNGAVQQTVRLADAIAVDIDEVDSFHNDGGAFPIVIAAGTPLVQVRIAAAGGVVAANAATGGRQTTSQFISSVLHLRSVMVP